VYTDACHHIYTYAGGYWIPDQEGIDACDRDYPSLELLIGETYAQSLCCNVTEA
jgi:hypothetical protein